MALIPGGMRPRLGGGTVVPRPLDGDGMGGPVTTVTSTSPAESARVETPADLARPPGGISH